MILKNITLGQYVHGNSFLHKLNPKIKLIFILAYVFSLFFITSFVSLGFCVLSTIIVYCLCKFSVKLMLQNLKIMFSILLIAFFLNLLFVRTGEPIFKFGFFLITTDSIKLTCWFILRFFLLISGSALLTYTTLPLDLTLAIEELLRPLSKIKVPAEEISIMLSIALRFIPVLLSESQIILSAQKSRGMSIFGQRSILKKANALTMFLIPLLVSSFKRASELAVSMEARCFQVGKKRTRYRSLNFHRFDFEFVFLCLIFLTIVVFLNIIF